MKLGTGRRPLRRWALRRWRYVLALFAVVAVLACSLTLAVLGGMTGGRAAAAGKVSSPDTRRSPGTLTAAGALRAFNAAFAVNAGKALVYRLSTAGGSTTLFKESELMEMAVDAYGRTHQPSLLRTLKALYHGLLLKEGRNWLRARSNDDLMWSALMCMHLYQATGDATYLSRARTIFDRTYARAWSADLGGGLWNTVARASKNTCVVAPAIMTAGDLYLALHVPRYLRIAKTLFAWMQTHLYDAGSGAVWDNVSEGAGGTIVDRRTFTYNQGGFLGAADLLYRITGVRAYHTECLKALAYTETDMTTGGGILKAESGTGPTQFDSAGGFKGIFVRNAWAVIGRYGLRGPALWLRANAKAAKACADARGLIDEDWSRPTGSGVLSAFSCSSAVVLLQMTGP